METIEDIAQSDSLGTPGRFLRLLINKADRRTAVSRVSIEQIQQAYGKRVFETIIPINTDIQQAELVRKTVIRHGDIIINGGGYVGNVASDFARLTHRDCTIYSFEPIPKVYTHLTDNIAERGLTDIVTTVNKALWSETGLVGFTIMLVDIDTPEDFQLAEAILQAGLFDFSAAATPLPVAVPASPAPAPRPLELALPFLALGEIPAGERITGRDLLRGALGQGLPRRCRDLAARLEAAGPNVPEETLLADLERLASLDPGLPALGKLLDRGMAAADAGQRPVGAVGSLAALFRHPERAWNLGLDNLVAVAGMPSLRGYRCIGLRVVSRRQR